jgi:dephospho-CoA kinase
MLKVGLTGGIGSGKSTVSAMFRDLGARVVDSDEIVHTLLTPGEPVHQAVVSVFGPAILGGDGRIDRAALGRIVFADAGRRETLNSIVHPEVGRRQEAFLEKAGREAPDGVAIVDAALMIETGSYRRYDRIVVVRCEPGVQPSVIATCSVRGDICSNVTRIARTANAADTENCARITLGTSNVTPKKCR